MSDPRTAAAELQAPCLRNYFYLPGCEAILEKWLAAHDAELIAKARLDEANWWCEYLNQWLPYEPVGARKRITELEATLEKLT